MADVVAQDSQISVLRSGDAGGDHTTDTTMDVERDLYDPYQHERTGAVREIGHQAVWGVSTCKPGFGVSHLRDNSCDTYWQSDGPQPHTVNIQFKRKTCISQVCLYSDFKQDESYTPFRISIRAGTNYHDLREVDCRDINEPAGWVRCVLNDTASDSVAATAPRVSPVRAYLLQVAILSNHQNGRDTHLRQIRVHTPVQRSCVHALSVPAEFVSHQCCQFAFIR